MPASINLGLCSCVSVGSANNKKVSDWQGCNYLKIQENFDISSEGPSASSESYEGHRSKRRSSPCSFQVIVSLSIRSFLEYKCMAGKVSLMLNWECGESLWASCRSNRTRAIVKLDLGASQRVFYLGIIKGARKCVPSACISSTLVYLISDTLYINYRYAKHVRMWLGVRIFSNTEHILGLKKQVLL
jgi:hypothetical protein